MSSDTMIPHELRQSSHGQPMDPEPIGATLSAKAALLDAGETTYVHLEPGDGTRYDLLLVPMWARHVNAGALRVAPATSRNSVLVLNMLDTFDVGGAIVQRYGNYGVLGKCGSFSAPWTRTLLEWWFERHLWPRIDAIRGSAKPGDAAALVNAIGEAGECATCGAARWGAHRAGCPEGESDAQA